MTLKLHQNLLNEINLQTHDEQGHAVTWMRIKLRS